MLANRRDTTVLVRLGVVYSSEQCTREDFNVEAVERGSTCHRHWKSEPGISTNTDEARMVEGIMDYQTAKLVSGFVVIARKRRVAFVCQRPISLNARKNSSDDPARRPQYSAFQDSRGWKITLFPTEGDITITRGNSTMHSRAHAVNTCLY